MLAGSWILTLASTLAPMHNFCYITNMVLVEAVKHPLLNTQLLEPDESANTTVHCILQCEHTTRTYALNILSIKYTSMHIRTHQESPSLYAVGLLVSELLRTTFSQIKIRMDRFSVGKSLWHQFCHGVVKSQPASLRFLLAFCLNAFTPTQLDKCLIAKQVAVGGGMEGVVM